MNDFPNEHPERFDLDHEWWTMDRVAVLAAYECEWSRHVNQVVDTFEAADENVTPIGASITGWGDRSWLQLSLTVEALRSFQPSVWWPRRP